MKTTAKPPNHEDDDNDDVAKKPMWRKAGATVVKSGAAVGDAVAKSGALVGDIIQDVAKAPTQVLRHRHQRRQKKRNINQQNAAENMHEESVKENPDEDVTTVPSDNPVARLADPWRPEMTKPGFVPQVESSSLPLFQGSSSILLAVASVLLAAYPTFTYWSAATGSKNEGVPIPTVLTWMLVAFCFGRLELEVSSSLRQRSAAISEVHLSRSGNQRPTTVATTPPPRGIFSSLARNISQSSKQRFSFASRLSKAPMRILSAMNVNRDDTQKRRWEWAVDPIHLPAKARPPSALLDYLRTKEYIGGARRHNAAGSTINTNAMTTDDDAIQDSATVDKPHSSLGSFEFPSSNPPSSILQVEPIFRLRGMDVFLTKMEPETDLATHPWLIQQGLRDVPTFLTNILTQWGNILLYFEMPSWVQNLTTCLEEQPGDPPSAILLKRFLSGTDDYRNDRLFMIPSVVEAPTCVKLVAPAKREYLLHRPGILPVHWKLTDRAVDKSGKHRTLQPVVECELDCLTSRAIRGMAGVIKRHLGKLVVDNAVVLKGNLDDNNSDGVTTEQCCLGMWRFDHVDISECPEFPDRYESEALRTGVDREELRASRLSIQMKGLQM